MSAIATAAIGVFTVGATWAVASTFLRLVFLHSVPSTAVASRVFCGTFVLCGSLFTTLLYELTGVVSSDTAAIVLPVIVVTLLFVAVAVLPFVVARSFVLTVIGSPRVAAATGAAVVVALLLAGRALLHPCAGATAGPPLAAAVGHAVTRTVTDGAAAASEGCAGLYAATISRAGVVGVVVVAALGGFAAVATPAAYLAPLVALATPGQARRYSKALDALGRRQRYVIGVWASKQRALAQARLQLALSSGSGGGGGGGMFNRLKSAFDGSGSVERRIELLSVECEGYSTVSLGIFLETEEAADASRMVTAARTWRGAIYALYGVTLGVYCGFKVAVTAFNLVFGSFSDVDPVTNALTTAAAWIPTLPTLIGESIPSFAFRVAFGFNCIIIVSAIRGFLILIFRLTSHNRAVTAETSLLAFTWAMSLYFIGMALMMRKSLPAAFRQSLIGAVGGAAVPLPHYHAVHDAWFVVFVVGTGAAKRYLQGSETEFGAED